MPKPRCWSPRTSSSSPAVFCEYRFRICFYGSKPLWTQEPPPTSDDNVLRCHFLLFLVHVVFPFVFSGQTRPWAVQWLPQSMLTATADQLQDPSDSTSKHKRPQVTPRDPQESPNGQSRSPKATVGASKGRSSGRSKGTRSQILMETGLQLSW